MIGNVQAEYEPCCCVMEVTPGVLFLNNFPGCPSSAGAPILMMLSQNIKDLANETSLTIFIRLYNVHASFVQNYTLTGFLVLSISFLFYGRRRGLCAGQKRHK